MKIVSSCIQEEEEKSFQKSRDTVHVLILIFVKETLSIDEDPAWNPFPLTQIQE